MAFIKPFRARRPPKELAERVASLPYDVMDIEEARNMASGNEYSFLHVSRPEIDLPPGIDPHDDEVYRRGRTNLDRFIQAGILLPEKRECFYVYRQKMGNIIQTGIVACAGVDDYQAGVIKKHELTRADKEEDRVRHIDFLNANDEPVFFLCRTSKEIETIISTVASGLPEYDFASDDGVVHTLWVLDDGELSARLINLFEKIPHLYVADGHHRSAAAERVREIRRKANPDHTGNEEYNSFLTVIFPENQLNILPYNRAVKDLNGKTLEGFIKAVAETFDISPSDTAVIPCRRHDFGMYIDGRWYTLTARSDSIDESDTVARLDVSLLQENLLSPLLGIENPRTDSRIDFIGGIRGNEELVRLVDSGSHAVAFSLYPTSIRELLELADQDRIMPPKSTWFEPKLRSGLFVHLL